MTGTRLVVAAGVCGWSLAAAADPGPRAPKPAADEAKLVEQLVDARKKYQESLVGLYDHYARSGDREHAKWAEDELRAYHLHTKRSYRLDIQDVPPPTLEAKVNVREANDLYREAMEYKDKGYGTDYVLNERRAEIRLQEILSKYPNCDKIADVAYQLGDLYEGSAYKEYARSAAYFERAHQWKRGTQGDALLRAARIYDRRLTDKAKAIEAYREVTTHDTDPARLKEAERRLGELTGAKK